MDVAIDPRLTADENINLLLTRNSLTVRMLDDLSFGDPTAISLAEPTRTGLIITITGEDDTMAYPILYRRSDLGGIVEGPVQIAATALTLEAAVVALNSTRGFNLVVSDLVFEPIGTGTATVQSGVLKAAANSKLYIGQFNLTITLQSP